jgi:hypothetical protein
VAWAAAASRGFGGSKALVASLVLAAACLLPSIIDALLHSGATQAAGSGDIPATGSITGGVPGLRILVLHAALHRVRQTELPMLLLLLLLLPSLRRAEHVWQPAVCVGGLLPAVGLHARALPHACAQLWSGRQQRLWQVRVCGSIARYQTWSRAL